MDRPPELLAFAFANALLFAASSVLTGVSYLAYRQSGRQRSYRFATVGFGFVLLGGLVEPVYQFGVRGDYHLTGTELLWLQTSEGLFIAAGLGLLFWAIVRRETGTGSGAREESLGPTGEDRHGPNHQYGD